MSNGPHNPRVLDPSKIRVTPWFIHSAYEFRATLVHAEGSTAPAGTTSYVGSRLHAGAPAAVEEAREYATAHGYTVSSTLNASTLVMTLSAKSDWWLRIILAFGHFAGKSFKIIDASAALSPADIEATERLLRKIAGWCDELDGFEDLHRLGDQILYQLDHK